MKIKNKITKEEESYLLDNLDFVLDNLNDGLLLINLKGKILKINKALLAMGGYSQSDLLGKNAMKLASIFPPVSLKRIARSFLDAAKGVPNDRYNLEAKTKAGEPRIIEVSNSLIKKNGKKIGIVVVVRDITERKKLEPKLKESEEQYRNLYLFSKDAIMIIKPPTWKFVAGNPAAVKMFGAKDEKEFTALGPWDVSPKNQPDGQPSNQKSKMMIGKAMKEGFNFFEWTHKKVNGGNFSATVLLSRIKLKGKEVLQATVRDITQQKESAEKLKNRTEELERINRLMVNREMKMIELKEEIKQLKKSNLNK